MFPRAKNWGLEFLGPGDHKGDLKNFSLFLDFTWGDRVNFLDQFLHIPCLFVPLKNDETFSSQVKWNVWDRLNKDYLVRSRVLTQSRVLLECPYGWQWYMGDRVSHQSLEIDHFRVLSPIHPFVQRTHEYIQAEIERYIVLIEVIFSPSIDYEGYINTHLVNDLDMENRLRVALVLPKLRREI